MREYLTPANLVTSASLASGFGALLASQQALGVAVALVAGSVLLDGVDGALARRSGNGSAFGGQLDSLTDVICFGVVPAAALWWALLYRLPVLGAVVCGAFLVAGAWRLARFHVVSRPDRFVGLPIPPAGLAVMLLALWSPVPALAAVLTLVLSGLMISTLPFPTVPAMARAVARRATVPVARPSRPAGALRMGRRRRRGAPALRRTIGVNLGPGQGTAHARDAHPPIVRGMRRRSLHALRTRRRRD